MLAALAALILVDHARIWARRRRTESAVDPQPLRLVYLAIPGPGGGGGGGGLKQIVKPPKAELKGAAHIDSPLPIASRRRRSIRRSRTDRRSPIPSRCRRCRRRSSSRPPNDKDRPGVMEPSPQHGRQSRARRQRWCRHRRLGTGIGEGQGSGIGDGQGGGTGGGPYRPGSGITPPTLLREVKPDYTEEARRRGVRGEVVMEIVVRRDGSVGDVKVLQGLGYGLDERAVAAVKQWKFSPATLQGHARGRDGGSVDGVQAAMRTAAS